jgi:hypothetical protein
MAGFISAPTSDGLGVIAIPPVSIWKSKVLGEACSTVMEIMNYAVFFLSV